MITFEKKGIEFKFESTGIEHGTVKYKYFISGITANKHDKDGFYYNAKFDKSKNAFTFGTHDILIGKKKSKINGVLLENDVLKQIEEIEKEEIKKYNNDIQQAINDVVSGKLPITFIKVGCDYEYYEAYLESSIKAVKDEQFKIIEKAMEILTGDKFCQSETLKDIAKKMFGDDFIFTKKGNSFEIALKEITDVIVKNKKENEEKQLKKEQELIQKAKETGEKQVLKSWSAPCNDKNEECDIDIITILIDAEGNKETTRTHTW